MDYQARRGDRAGGNGRGRGRGGRGGSSRPDPSYGDHRRDGGGYYRQHPAGVDAGDWRRSPAANQGHGGDGACGGQPGAAYGGGGPAVNYGRGGGYDAAQNYYGRGGGGRGQSSWAQAVMNDGRDLAPPAPARPGNGGDEGGRGGYGRGLSGRRGGRAEYVARSPTTTTTTTTPADSLASAGRNMELSPLPPALRSTPESGKLVPIQRPDKGGSSGTHRLPLLVNHFPLWFDENMVIYHYDFDVKPEKLPKSNAAPEITKSELSAIKTELFRANAAQFGVSTVAYDCERNIFSPVQLPVGEFPVVVRGHAYNVTIKLQKDVPLRELRRPPCPRDILQGLDVIMRENSRRGKIPVGRSIYSLNQGRDLGMGVVALQGFQQSIKSTENNLVLCVDYSVMPFRKPLMVLDFLRENLGITFNERTQFERGQRAVVERALKGLRVVVTHRTARQKFTVFGLTSLNTNDIKFTDENSAMEIRLVDYFKDKYQKVIRYKGLPCLNLSKNKQNHVPMEFCMLVEGQRFPKDRLDKYGDGKLREMALAKPSERKNKIFNVINSADGPCRGDMLDEFHMSVTTEITHVTGRILERPSLKLSTANGQPFRYPIPNSDCQWNLLKNKVSSGKRIERWAIANFSHPPRYNHRQADLKIEQFIHKLVERCHSLGILMDYEPLFVSNFSMEILSDPRWLHDTLTDVKKQAGGRLQLLICPMAGRHEGYKSLKLITETEVGIMTQCCLTPLVNQMKDQYFANLALKINAKLGGSNIELHDSLPRMGDVNSPVMFIGADVNHPSGHNITSPSIAAVVASINWPALNSYVAKVQAQPHRTENIMNVGEMCRELVEKYAQANKAKPQKIIYFRDGVSDSQFNMVLNEELRDIKTAIESDGYKPAITVVVAQKRHSTRLFPKDSHGPLCTKTGNVPPGTVVDTGIVAPYLFNFYLCSHNGILGTSKPTHYYVLWDEQGFTSDEVQKLVYNLCFTFARCTKPVSLVPPVYYADLLAYRGRLYIEALELKFPASSTASSSSSSSSVFPASFDDPGSFPKLHRDVENGMYFV